MPEAVGRRVAGQQARWDALRSAVRSQRSAPAIVPAPAGEPLPASFAQQRLWFLEQLAGPSAQHNLSVVCRLQGALNEQALEQGLARLLQRHAVLRSTLHWQDGRLLQRVHEAMPFALPMTDLGSHAEPHRQQLAHECAAAQAAQPFELARPPWLRARLLRLAANEQWLVLTFHHLAFDGWSFEVFMGELGELYGAFSKGQACALTEPALQYADYAAWQRRWMSAGALQPQLEYWKRQLAGPLPVLRLPTDRPRTSFAARRGASLPLALPSGLSQRLRKLAADEGVTPSTLLLAAFQVLLHRYTGDEDLIVGTPVAQRARPELAGLVGPLLNMLALRGDLTGRPTFREFLARANVTVQDALANQDLAFEQLVEALDLPRSNDAAPGVQVTFSYQNLPPSGWSLPGLQCEAWNVPSGSAAFEASLAMWEKNGALGGLLDYDAGLFDAAGMQQLLACFETLLQAIADDADSRIDRLALLPASSLQALRDWNATQAPYPRDATVHALFEAQAARTPHAVALAWRGGRLCYADLDRRADTLAGMLRDAGVVAGHRVAIRLASGPAFVIAVLAVLKCEATYVPLSPSEPVARVKAGLRGAGVACVIGQEAGEPLASALHASLIVLDAAGAGVLAARAAASPETAGTAGIACVMFTSGSTGAPKGVCVPHRGVVRLVQGQSYARMGPGEVSLQLAPVAFDASAFEIWAALLHGGTLAFPAVQQPSLADIGDAVREHGVTTLWLTTGLFEAMVGHGLAGIAGCRQVLVGGDVLPVAHALRFLREAPACSLTHFYGPTENSTFTTFCPLSLELLEGAASVPIGRPIANSQLWVLDPQGQPVPPGVTGEAWVGGDGVMPGYLDDPQASAQCLAPDPFGTEPGALRYRTGDRVRLRSDGELEFVGRIDRQLKLRGFRVEPGECEQVLATSPLVQAVAVVPQTGPGGPQLVAHVVPDNTAPAWPQLEVALRSHVQALLPAQLQPSAWVPHQALPLDASGKIDRRALMAQRPDASPKPASGPATSGVDGRVAQAFARVLGRPEVDPDASFFDLGGHSLLALKLVGVLEQALGERLPLALLFRHSSVASLSAALRHSQPASAQVAPGVVELRRGRPGPALFIVPGGRGGQAEMTLYARLLGHASLPAWGLLARGLDGREAPHESVAEMARDGIEQVRLIQPAGPWLIAGECVGGVIAHEMVRQMRQQGLEAALLLMDSWCPTDAGVRHYWRTQRPRTLARERRLLLRSAWADLSGVLLQHLRDRPAFGLRSWLLYGGRVARTLLRIASAWRTRIARVGQAEPGQETAAAVGENYVAVAMRHRPAPGEMRAALLVTERNLALGLAGDWQRLLPGLQVVTVPGDHESYLRDTPGITAQGFMSCLAALGFPER